MHVIGLARLPDVFEDIYEFLCFHASYAACYMKVTCRGADSSDATQARTSL